MRYSTLAAPRPAALTDLPNISFVLAEQLQRIGITCDHQLRAIGAVAAAAQLQAAGLRPVDARVLLALEGAIEGVPWQSLPADVRGQLIRVGVSA